MRVRKDEERSTESLTIRMKPSIKEKLGEIADSKGIKMAEAIEIMVQKEFKSIESRIKIKN